MNQRTLDDAYEYWMGLGPERSVEQVATHFRVQPAVVKRWALQGHWEERKLQVEEWGRKGADKALAETQAQMLARHRKYLRAVQVKALEKLAQGFETTGVAVRALLKAIELEHQTALAVKTLELEGLVDTDADGVQPLNILELMARPEVQARLHELDKSNGNRPSATG